MLNAPMQLDGNFLTDLAIVTAVAAVTGLLARALRQPSILGHLLAGLIVGPYIPIPLFADPHRIETLAEFGVVLVMFAVGLEFRFRRLFEILPVSGFTALFQIAVLLWAGFSLGSALGWTPVASAVLGACIAISSTMVVSSVFAQLDLEQDLRSHVLGVLVVQDVVAIVLMAVVTSAAAGTSLAPEALALLVAQLSGVILAMLAIGMLVVPRLVHLTERLAGEEGLSVLAVGVAFGFAAIAHGFGYSVALGAFLAGMVVAESGRGAEVEHAIAPLRGVFSAVFFVSIGMTVNPSVALHSLPVALVLTAVIVLAQLLSVTLGSVLSGVSLRRGLLAGLSLGQIGELSFILATIGTAGGIVPDALLPTLVTVATLTAFTTPLLLRKSGAVVAAVDHVLPQKVHHILAVHQGFMARLTGRGSPPPLRRAATAVVLDWVALVFVGVGRWAAMASLDARDGSAEVWVNLAAVVIAVPFVVGLVRSARRFRRELLALARSWAGREEMARGLEALSALAVTLGVGFPTLAVLRPLLGSSWLEACLFVALVLAVALLGRRLGRFDGEYTSGVATLALGLADRASPRDTPSPDAPPPDEAGDLLLALQPVAFTVPPGSAAVGRSLAELDLRSRTGATVLAIHRPGAPRALPTGTERLLAGDVLALAGSAPAVTRAEELMRAEA